LVVHVGGEAVFADRSVPLHRMPMRAPQRKGLDPECNPRRFRTAMYPVTGKWDPVGARDPIRPLPGGVHLRAQARTRALRSAPPAIMAAGSGV
jgi:hypothetical protein